MPKKKASRSALPEKPPKRTGKRGVGPKLDPVADFDSPVKKDPPEAKGSLLANVPPAPSVANGRFKIFYDRPFWTKFKDRILVALQCSVPLEEGHANLLPKIIADAWHDVMKKG